MSNTELNVFTLDDFVDNPTILIVGSRGCGKTTLCNSILNKLNADKKVVVHHNTDFELNKYVPMSGEFEHVVFDNEATNTFETILLDHIQTKMTHSAHRTVVCVDSSWYKERIFRDPSFKEMLFNGRHRDISVIVTATSACEVPCDIAVAFKYVFAFRTTSENETSYLFLRLFNSLKSIEHFEKLMAEHTKNRATLVNIRCTGTDDIRYHTTP